MTVSPHTSDDADASTGASANADPADAPASNDDRNPSTARLSAADDAPTEKLAPLPLTMPLPVNLPPRPEVPKKKAKKAKRPQPLRDLPGAAGGDTAVVLPGDAGDREIASAPAGASADADREAPTAGTDEVGSAGTDEVGSAGPDAGAESGNGPESQSEPAAHEPEAAEPDGTADSDEAERSEDAAAGEAAQSEVIAEVSETGTTGGTPTVAIPPIGPDTELPPQKRPAKTRPKQLAWSNLPGSEPIPLGAVAGGVDVTGTHPTLPPITAGYTAALAASAATGATPTAPATATNTTPTAATATIGVANPDADTPDPEAPAPAKKTKKRRRRRALIVTLSTIVVVLALAGIAASIAWNVGETRASSSVKQTVQQKVDKAFGLAASHPVAVTFDEPVLPQIWAGTIDTLSFTVAGVPLVGSTAVITVHATDVPTSGSGAPKTVETDVRLKADALKSLVEAHRTGLGQILPETVKVSGDRVTVSLNPAQFLSGVSFTEVLTASVKDENLVLTPKEFIVGGQAMSADTVRARFGALAQGILATRTICLADTYPKGMTLTGLDVKKDAVVADFDVEPGILSDPALQAKGTCK